MKYSVLALLIAGFFLVMPHAYAELYDTDGNQKFKFTDTEGNQYKVYQKSQKIMFSQEILNNRNYTLIGDTEIKLDENSINFYKIILSQKFELPIGKTISPSSSWIPEQSGLYSMKIIVNYNNPPGAIEGFLTHEEGGDDIIIVDKFSKAYSKNYQCKEDYFPLAKPNYSNLSCFSGDSVDALKQRGWHPVIT